jgi:hypothetical protein
MGVCGRVLLTYGWEVPAVGEPEPAVEVVQQQLVQLQQQQTHTHSHRMFPTAWQ